MNKIIFLGMCNPQGNSPLSLDPRGGAGWRLHALAEAGLGKSVDEKVWHNHFDFRNVLPGTAWDAAAAREAAAGILEDLRGRRVVLLGQAVGAALRLSQKYPCMWVSRTEPTLIYALLPHPSGRNRWYNDPLNLNTAQKFVASLW